MWIPRFRLGRILLTFSIAGLLVPAFGADTKPDKKKSQAAYQRGLHADQAGKRDEAVAAYTEAIEADASNNSVVSRAAFEPYLVKGCLLYTSPSPRD